MTNLEKWISECTIDTLLVKAPTGDLIAVFSCDLCPAEQSCGYLGGTCSVTFRKWAESECEQ